MYARLRDWFNFWVLLIVRFLTNRSISNAAALTYTTLFAVVPMMTLTFTMLSSIPAFQDVGEDIQQFIFRTFVPSAGETVQHYLREFTGQARQLTWIGVALLAVTAFMMLLTIEKTFNEIWRVRHARRGLSSFLLYWAILSLGPILLGAGFVVSTYIASLSLLSGPDALVGAQTLLGLMPLAFSIAAFTLLYCAVPNTTVPLRHALIGGAFSAVLFEVAKGVFAFYIRYFPGYHLIYGAFASVPLFLLWIYVSWLIVLFGAEMVCTLSQPRLWRRKPMLRMLILLRLLRMLLDRQQQGEALHYSQITKEGWPLPRDEFAEVLDFLEREQLACRISGGGWVLSRDLHQYSMLELLNSCPWQIPKSEELADCSDEPWYETLKESLEQLEQEQKLLFEVSLADWLGGHAQISDVKHGGKHGAY